MRDTEETVIKNDVKEQERGDMKKKMKETKQKERRRE